MDTVSWIRDHAATAAQQWTLAEAENNPASTKILLQALSTNGVRRHSLSSMPDYVARPLSAGTVYMLLNAWSAAGKLTATFEALEGRAL